MDGEREGEIETRRREGAGIGAGISHATHKHMAQGAGRRVYRHPPTEACHGAMEEGREMLKARWVTLRARWVTLRDRWVTLRAR
jgi:hypothetical protein